MSAPTRGPEHTTGCDTGEMVVVHGFFRHLLSRAPALVRGVAAGDVARAKVVGEHVAEITAGLHNHHQAEDELLWDDLETRAPACALHVGLMRTQHAAVAERIAVLEEVLPRWLQEAHADDRETVATAVESIAVALAQHLGDEEQKILPVVATTFTQTEWDRLGEHARRHIPKDRLLVQLGWILESMPPDEGAAFLRRALPLPVRLMWTLMGRRQFEAHRRSVLGRASTV